MKAFGILVFLLAIFTGFAQAQDVPKGRDTFSIKALPKTWQADSNRQSLMITGDSSFVMAAAVGTDLHYPTSRVFKRHNAPKVLFKPGADFDFSAKLKPSSQSDYNGGGLLLYTDTTQWAKVLFQRAGDKYIIGMSVVEHSVTDDSYFPVNDVVDIWLRVKKSGATCSFFVSTNGLDWRLARQFAYTNPENMRLGFYAQSPLGPQCTVYFSAIRYTEGSK